MFDKEIIIATPWFGEFAGGAEWLARGMARELNRRGVRTKVFTTCSRSPYDSWWDDFYESGEYTVDGTPVTRFSTAKSRDRYQAVVSKQVRGETLTAQDMEDFFTYGINSESLVDAIGDYINERHEVIASPYFHGLTYSIVNRYPGRISLAPCFHDEPQFYWPTTERLLINAKHIFFNSPEEKVLAIKRYGRIVGRRLVESSVPGVGIELTRDELAPAMSGLGLPETYFLYAGRKEVGKNVPLLCSWFDEYADRTQSDAKLVFIGGGDPELVPLNNRFTDLGFVAENLKRQVIRHSRGVINLSENESFSIVIMEGWLLGVPAVVSARCEVTKGHVRRANGGLYVSNSEEFADALGRLCDNDSFRQRLGDNGRGYVLREFSFDTVLQKYLQGLSSMFPATTQLRPTGYPTERPPDCLTHISRNLQ